MQSCNKIHTSRLGGSLTVTNLEKQKVLIGAPREYDVLPKSKTTSFKNARVAKIFL